MLKVNQAWSVLEREWEGRQQEVGPLASSRVQEERGSRAAENSEVERRVLVQRRQALDSAEQEEHGEARERRCTRRSRLEAARSPIQKS